LRHDHVVNHAIAQNGLEKGIIIESMWVLYTVLELSAVAAFTIVLAVVSGPGHCAYGIDE
jgi:hypothetical protein